MNILTLALIAQLTCNGLDLGVSAKVDLNNPDMELGLKINKELKINGSVKIGYNPSKEYRIEFETKTYKPVGSKLYLSIGKEFKAGQKLTMGDDSIYLSSCIESNLHPFNAGVMGTPVKDINYNIVLGVNLDKNAIEFEENCRHGIDKPIVSEVINYHSVKLITKNDDNYNSIKLTRYNLQEIPTGY